MLAEQFPTNVRYTALSISYGFAVAIFGGFAPLICTWLVSVTGDAVAPAYYLIGAGVLSLVATFFAKERAGKPMPDEAFSSTFGRAVI
jgi:MHS family proline/betaine transporter-like MFS transporter